MASQKSEEPKILTLSGTPAEMGRQHGELIGEMVHIAIDEYLRKSEVEFQMPRAFLSSLVDQAAVHIPVRFLEEIEALADASSVSRDDLLALNCLPDIHNCMATGQSQCCNFVALGQALRTGQLMHARNLDFPHLGILPRISVVICRKPSDMRFRSTVSVSWAGCIGTLTGINSSRLTAAEADSMCPDSTMKGTPVAFLIRDALERSDELSSFTAIVREASRAGGFNFAITDGDALDARCIEYTPSLCEVRRPRHEFLIVDNPCFCPSTAKMRTGYYWSAFRHARLAELVKAKWGSIDYETAIEILKDRYDIAFGLSRGRGFRCISNHSTIQSVVFLPAEDRMYVAHGHVPATAGEYKEVDLTALW